MWGCALDSCGSEQGPVDSSCEHSNVHSVANFFTIRETAIFSRITHLHGVRHLIYCHVMFLAEIKAYVYCTVFTQAQLYTDWCLYSVLYCICTTFRDIQHMHNSVMWRLYSLPFLQWQTVSHAKNPIMFHVIHAVHEPKFNIWWHQHGAVNRRIWAVKQIHPTCFCNLYLLSSGVFIISNKATEG
jgi:hypothetical protein